MTIVETSTQEPTFAALSPSPTARLVRAHEAPDLSELEPGDMVICDERTAPPDYVSRASAQGVSVRLGRYRVEDERIATSGRRRAVTTEYIHVLASSGSPIAGRMFDPRSVEASSDAFARTWDTLSAPLDTATPYSDAREHLPAEWAHYLPFPTLNPAQVQAAPTLVSDRSAVVVAPTGAGKTVIGMIAALREIVSQGGKAAWLVPQRSLTAELDRELDHWRAKGLRIATLSGDRQLDSDEARSADLWVSTTEKFEALCRASSMRDAIAAIGTLVVDEIHLLGEPGRGPTLSRPSSRAYVARTPQSASSACRRRSPTQTRSPPGSAQTSSPSRGDRRDRRTRSSRSRAAAARTRIGGATARPSTSPRKSRATAAPSSSSAAPRTTSGPPPSPSRQRAASTCAASATATPTRYTAPPKPPGSDCTTPTGRTRAPPRPTSATEARTSSSRPLPSPQASTPPRAR